MRIWIIVHTHRFGTNHRATNREDFIPRIKNEVAADCWQSEFSIEEMPPYDEVGDIYFERMMERGEFFEVIPCELEEH